MIPNSLQNYNLTPADDQDCNKLSDELQYVEGTAEGVNEDDIENADESLRVKILENMRRLGTVNSGQAVSQRIDLAEMKRLIYKTADSKILILPPMSTILINERFNIYCLSATTNAILSVLSIYTSALLCDIEYDELWKSNWSLWFHISFFNTLTTLLLIISIIWHANSDLSLKKAELIFSERESIFTSKKHNFLIVEIILNLIHPIWLLRDLKIEFYNEVLGRHYYHSVNTLLCIFVLIKFYHCIKLALIKSHYNSARAHRVCKINGVLANRFWVLKCTMIAHPFKSVSWMLIVGIIMGGYCIRILERPLVLESAKIGFNDFGNSVWCIIITMTTVGFGDITPTTVLGRVVGTMSCIWGVFVVALMVVGVNSMMEFDSGQEKSFTIYQRLNFKTLFKKLAANVLKNAFKLKVIMKKNFNDDKKVLIHKSNYKRSIIAFQQGRIQSKILYNLNTPERKIEDKINISHSLSEETLQKSQKIFQSLQKLHRIHQQKEDAQILVN